MALITDTDDVEPARVEDIDLNRFASLAKEALIEHAYAVGADRPTVTGIAVVGSTLRADFEAGQSDFDFYVLTDEQSDYDGFWRYLNDDTTAWNRQLEGLLPDEFACIDCLGVLEDGSSELDDPHETITL